MAENKFRSRTMALLLYPDDLTHQKAMDIIKANYDYIGILHDKDCDEDGVKKKEHWHVILRFKNANWNTSVSKELGIESNYTEQIRNLDNSIMYLIHYNDSDKYQYGIDEVFGTFKNRLKDIINNINKNEGEKVVELIEYIEQRENYLTVTEFAKYCASNGYWSEFRRSGAIFCKMIEEKNDKLVNRKNVQSP